MAWSWSHSAEAYEYAYKRLHKLAKARLHEIWAEWKTYQKAQADKLAEEQKEAEEEDWPIPEYLAVPSHDFDQDYYKEQLKEARAISKRVGSEALADEIWEWASEFATCTNGGWEAWMCPYGCGCHLIPFGPKEKSA